MPSLGPTPGRRAARLGVGKSRNRGRRDTGGTARLARCRGPGDHHEASPGRGARRGERPGQGARRGTRPCRRPMVGRAAAQRARVAACRCRCAPGWTSSWSERRTKPASIDTMERWSHRPASGWRARSAPATPLVSRRKKVERGPPLRRRAGGSVRHPVQPRVDHGTVDLVRAGQGNGKAAASATLTTRTWSKREMADEASTKRGRWCRTAPWRARVEPGAERRPCPPRRRSAAGGGHEKEPPR